MEIKSTSEEALNNFFLNIVKKRMDLCMLVDGDNFEHSL